jgi:3-phosphoglycerate kinase
MDLPKLSELNVNGKSVVLRLDLDVSGDISRIKATKQTLNFLVSNSAKTAIIGHKGRPQSAQDTNLSLGPLTKEISEIAGREVRFVNDIVGNEAKNEVGKLEAGGLLMLENLRFDPREEQNDQGFARELATLGEVYVNEAFAVSHRVHASIVGVPKFLPHAAGFRFVKEIENLGLVLEGAKSPRIVIVSGIKKDKVEMAKTLTQKFDKVLVAGRLPEYMGDNTVSVRSLDKADKLLVANLIMDKEDITIHSVERFKEEIAKAGTIVLAGVPGRYEDKGHRQGTKEIFEAVASSDAYKVAGGGDTLAAIDMFKLASKFDWISVGGGAMLEFLAKGTLPGIEALLE